MDINSVYNNQIDLQSLLINSAKGINKTNKNDSTNKTAYYAQKGEPMYMDEMDADKDGIVTLDEFREYSKSNGINSKQMIKMSQIASSFRVMKAEEGAIDNIKKLIPNFPKLKQTESKSGNIKQSENLYNISNDSSKDKKVSYQEYMEYCKQNAVSDDLLNDDVKVEDTKDGSLKISKHGKALKAYKNSESNFIKSTFEEAVE